jgi:hypothetical protein
MNTSNIDEIDLIITTRVYKDLPGLNGVEINMRAKLTEEAKARVQQELLKARIDEISILRNGYGWGDALETSEYILDDRLDDLQAKLKGDDK